MQLNTCTRLHLRGKCCTFVWKLAGQLYFNFNSKKKHQMELTGTSFTYFYINEVLNAGFLLVGGFLVQVSYHFLF